MMTVTHNLQSTEWTRFEEVGCDLSYVEDIMSDVEKAQKLREGTLKLEFSVEYFENADFYEQVSKSLSLKKPM